MLEKVFKRAWSVTDRWAGLEQSEAPHPLNCPRNVRFPLFPVEAVSSRQKGAAETIWTVEVTDPSEGLYLNFYDSGSGCGDLFISWPPKTGEALLNN